MQLLNRIVKILKGFSTAEIYTLRNYLAAFAGEKNEEQLKSGKLFELIIKSKFLIKEADLRKEFSSDINPRYFDRILLNLKHKISESLTLDINIERRNAYSESSKAKINIKKQLAQAFILRGRGLTAEVSEMYDQMIHKAKDFELYDDLVEILRNQKSAYTLINNLTAFNSLLKEIKHYEYCRDVTWSAKDYYYQLVLNVEYKSNNGKNFVLLVEAISHLEHEMLIIDSANVKFYLLYLKTHYFQESGLYEKAQLELEALIILLNTNKAVYTPSKLANAIMNLGENLLYQSKLKDCLDTCTGAEKLVKNDLFNYAILKEIEFNANFYLGNYDKSLNIINELLSDKRLTVDDFRRSKRYYMKACVCFMKGENKKVKNLLEMTNEIKTDKEGWNIGIRVLEIINQIEISSISKSLPNKIDKLRKFSIRQNKISPISQRDLMIKNLLVESEKLNYDFELLYSKRKKDIEKLSGKKDANSWKFPSAEYVLFHEWLECKRAGTKYAYPLSNVLEDHRSLLIELDVPVKEEIKETLNN